MRITTWNINGMRTLRQYRPWYALKDWQACLDHLQADIICFQEVKLTRKKLIADHRDMCVPEGYDAFYSLHPTKGYSGVATFVKKESCRARKAEEGLTGDLVANRLDDRTAIGGYPDLRAPELPVYPQIDQEGRAVVVDCGLFVLFNLYSPNETDEGRREYKMAHYLTLAERVENLLAKGREVIIVGDLNIAHLPIDHCDGVNQRTRQEHLDIHPARHWLDHFLAPNGDFHDVTRKMHPTRKFMYTCWDTVKDTRPANYGVRIDYTLVSRNLLPWIKGSDIQADVFGSDHCPVYVDLYDEIQNDKGQTIKLRDVLLGNDATVDGRPKKAPRLATSNWPEFSGRTIRSFFAPKVTQKEPEMPAPTQSPQPEDAPIPRAVIPSSPPPTVKTPPRIVSLSPDKDVRKSDKAAAVLKKGTITGRGKGAASPGQSTLHAFFSQPAAQQSISSQRAEEERPSTAEVGDVEAQSSASQLSGTADPPPTAAAPDGDADEDDDDPDSSASRVTAALAWGSIFAPKQPPLCTRHREPARAWTVNKAGPNHGRKFWMCARPVGSRGTGNEADDIDFRCGYWKWDSDIRARQVRQDRAADGAERSFHEVAGRTPRLGSGDKREWSSREDSAPHKSTVKRVKQEQKQPD